MSDGRLPSIASSYLERMSEKREWDVRGKTILVTGGNSGIGRATALELARRGAHVVITARDPKKGAAAVAELSAQLQPDAGLLEWRLLDLADARSIREFSAAFLAEFAALDVLVHNAGLVLSERRETQDGFEATFGTNHLGPFLLTQLLTERLAASSPARVVVVASDAHRQARGGLDFNDLQAQGSYSGVKAYGRSKLANILFARALARRLEPRGVTVNALHPGVVATGFTKDGDAGGLWGFVFRWLRPLLLTPEKGARTSVYLASSPEVSDITGAYFAKERAKSPSAAARDDAAAEQLWEVSGALVATAGRGAL